MAKILYMTDLYYPAKGRAYYAEDLYLTNRLKDVFDLVLCHPKNSEPFEQNADLIVFRNTGSVLGYKEVFSAFKHRVQAQHLHTYNDFTGKADMCGKQYLLDLTVQGYPVIPTIDRLQDLSALPQTDRYVLKPKDGADSIGLEFVSRGALLARTLPDGATLLQPAIDFQYEVSFYFVNDILEYALYAPNPARRWELQPYAYTDTDAAFAKRFICWNTIQNGIQRVDACRTNDGNLLLVELEDLNPYLSVSLLDDKTRERFLSDWIDAMRHAI